MLAAVAGAAATWLQAPRSSCSSNRPPSNRRHCRTTTTTTTISLCFLFLLFMLRLPTLSSASAASSSPCGLEAFQAFCERFDKKYTSEPQEFARRFEAWTRSCIYVEEYKANNPNADFDIALNHLSDRTPEEHEAMFGFKVKNRRAPFPPPSSADDAVAAATATTTSTIPSQSTNDDATTRALQGFRKRDRSKPVDGDEYGDLEENQVADKAPILEARDLPAAVDWRTASLNPEGLVAVTPVKNQGSCGACWAFSSAAAIEGAVAVTTKILNELSYQELIDCVTQNDGCNGGDFDYAFAFAKQKGLSSSSDYRFTMKEGACRAGDYPMASKITAAYETDTCSMGGLMNIVARRPVAVAIDGSCDAFVQYSGGLYTQSCGTELNHAVTIVGYGTDYVGSTAKPYWIIKNSWGKTWGSSGYGKIARGVSPCGVSRIEEYGYYAAGGTAFVNGTGFFSDDALAQDPNVGFLDRILQWKYLHVVLGIAIALLVLPLILSFFRSLRRCCCPPAGAKANSNNNGRAGGAAAVVVPMGSGGGGGRTPPQRRSPSPPPGGVRRSPSPPRVPPPARPPPSVPVTEWVCTSCTFLNNPRSHACQICGNIRR